jgi:hypothetical protein
MNYNILTYIFYLLITLFVVLYVGSVLYRNGRPFLINTFKGDSSIADALNKVLLAGYYLINTGYTIMVLKIWDKVANLEQMMNVLSVKAGWIILILGIMHIINVILLLIVGRNKKETIYNTNLKTKTS